MKRPQFRVDHRIKRINKISERERETETETEIETETDQIERLYSTLLLNVPCK